jgi:hypothetical protein
MVPALLWSFWVHMNTVRAKVLCVRAHNFAAVKDNFYQLTGAKPFKSPAAAREQFLVDLRHAIEECGDLGLVDAALTLTRIKAAVARQAMDASRLQGEAEHAYNAYVDGINKLKYIFIPEPLCGLVDQDKLFGEAVWKKFPKSRDDVRDAGNCLAIGCGTAAVFHLMRVSEHGMRALARRLRVRLSHSKANHPLEYADCNKVITGIKSKIAGLRALSPGPKKQRQIEFYSDLADQCEYIKDAWRNTVSHSRKPFSLT